jgi:hypothetical protein
VSDYQVTIPVVAGSDAGNFFYITESGEGIYRISVMQHGNGCDNFDVNFLSPQTDLCMNRLLTALLLITILSGCKKETHEPQVAKPKDLLTDGKWLLVRFGYDDDNSGAIEDYENLVMDCQKDNTIQYFTDGRGQTRDNQDVCQSPSGSEFEWKFVDNEKAIEILFQRYDLQKLTRSELHFVLHFQGITTAAHVIYRKL